jgi:predicted transcriptional regulator
MIYQNESGKFNESTLARKLKEQKQNIHDNIQRLEQWNIIERKEESLKEGKGGIGKYIYHTDYGALLYLVLSPPNIKKINRAIRNCFIELHEIPSSESIAEVIEVSTREKNYMIAIEKLLAKFKKNIKILDNIVDEISNKEKQEELKLEKVRGKIIKKVNKEQKRMRIDESEEIIKLLLKKNIEKNEILA